MAWIVLFLVLLNPLELIAAQQTAFITELLAYSSLDKCAASAVSSVAVIFPAVWCSRSTVATALASCICLQFQLSLAASNQIAFDVTVSCGASSSGELSSALNVLTTYCQPAENTAAASTTPASPTSSPGTLQSVSSTPTSTGALTTSSSPEKSASSSSISNDNPSNTNLSPSTSSTTTFTSSMTTSISPTPTSTSSSSSGSGSGSSSSSTSGSNDGPGTNPQNLSHSSWSGGKIAGVTIGSFAGAVFAGILLLLAVKRLRRRSAPQATVMLDDIAPAPPAQDPNPFDEETDSVVPLRPVKISRLRAADCHSTPGNSQISAWSDLNEEEREEAAAAYRLKTL